MEIEITHCFSKEEKADMACFLLALAYGVYFLLAFPSFPPFLSLLVCELVTHQDDLSLPSALLKKRLVKLIFEI